VIDLKVSLSTRNGDLAFFFLSLESESELELDDELLLLLELECLACTDFLSDRTLDTDFFDRLLEERSWLGDGSSGLENGDLFCFENISKKLLKY
jgi:hypothetical protein